MVHIRELFKQKTEPRSQMPTAAPKASAAPVTAAPTQDYSGSVDMLYEQLLGSCAQTLSSVEAGEGVVLNRLPQLTESLTSLSPREEDELLGRCFNQDEPYSLAQHSVNVAVLIARMGKALDFGEAFIRDLTLMGCLHDVGMVPINDWASKTERYSTDQKTALQDHPLQSRRLLNANRNIPGFVGEIAALEHERDDGSGYPNRLAGKSLNDYGQLLGMVDMYEALTHERPFRPRLTSIQALRLILDEQRHLFNPELLNSFVRSVPSYPPGTLVQLNSGRYAKVVRSSQGAVFSPIVRLYQDSSRGLELSPYYLDLKEEPQHYIVKELEVLP